MKKNKINQPHRRNNKIYDTLRKYKFVMEFDIELQSLTSRAFYKLPALCLHLIYIHILTYRIQHNYI